MIEGKIVVGVVVHRTVSRTDREAMEARTSTSTLEESAIIERVARIMFSVRGAKQDYTRLAAELEQAVPFDVFGVVLLRHDRQAVRVTVCYREGGDWISRRHQHPLSDSRLERVLQAPELQVSDYPDGLDGPPAVSGDALSGYHQLHSTLIVPLMVEDRVLGTLELGSTALHTYADVSLQRLVHAVVRMLATAIESAQLGGNAAIQDRQRRALRDVTNALTSKMDLATILDQIVCGISDALNVASCIVLYERREQQLRLEAQSGLDPIVLQAVLRAEWPLCSTCIIGHALLQRRPVISHDIAVDERFPSSIGFFARLAVRSLFCYPLHTGTTVYGALLLCSAEPGGFTPLKADILALFANQATVAIHNGLLLESVRQRSRFQEAIEQLEQAHTLRTAAPSGQDAVQEEIALLDHVRREAQRTLGVDFTSLLRFISDHLLTQSERDLQAVFFAEQSEGALGLLDVRKQEGVHQMPGDVAEPVMLQEVPVRHQKGPFTETLSLLAQTAESALTRAARLGELSRLLGQLKQATNWVNDAWFVIDLDGVCTYMNPAAEAFCDLRLGVLSSSYPGQLLAREQPMALKIEDLFVKVRSRMRNLAEVEEYLQDFAHGSVHRQELRCVLAQEPVNGSLSAREERANRHGRPESAPTDHYYLFTRYPLYSQAGQLEANALQLQDVTEQVRDEKNRSALLSSVSHDLRTPLTTIKAAVTGLLQADVPWEEQDRRAMLEDIDSEADHLTTLVNALVELSRIEMGALILEKEWCDLREIVHGVLPRLARVLAGRPVRLRLPAALPLLYVDHAQIERVFYNLLENVARHSPAQAEIVIQADVLAEGEVRVQVIDPGLDIGEDERERIFKSFYNLRSYGNGMALAICRGIVEAHQGRIWVEAADEGTRFLFTLPLHPRTIVHSKSENVSDTSKDS